MGAGDLSPPESDGKPRNPMWDSMDLVLREVWAERQRALKVTSTPYSRDILSDLII